MKFHSDYTYLCFSLVSLLVFLVGLMACRKQSRPMRFSPWISALLSAPFAFLSCFFIPSYWEPVRITEFWSTGIEDIIFSFANGGMVWIMATSTIRNRLILNIQTRRLLWRYLVCTVSGISFGMPLFLLGFDNPMHITFIGMAAATAVLLWLRKELWPLLVVGALSFGFLYTVACSITFALALDFIRQWNAEALLGFCLLGVPIEEITWSVSFGGLWPLIVAFIFDVRLPVQQKKTEGSDRSTAWKKR
jgi:hypothetical protein